MLKKNIPEAVAVEYRSRQVIGLLLLAGLVLCVALSRAHWGDLFPAGWWRW